MTWDDCNDLAIVVAALLGYAVWNVHGVGGMSYERAHETLRLLSIFKARVALVPPPARARARAQSVEPRQTRARRVAPGRAKKLALSRRSRVDGLSHFCALSLSPAPYFG